MKRFVILTAIAVLSSTAVRAQEPPKPPAPQKEHEWLKQLAGEWVNEAEMLVEPGKPPVKCKSNETAKSLGGFWVIAETKGDFMGVPMTGVMTVGFDTAKKKFVGTWVCSMDNYMWKYEGTLKDNVLTLESEGPNPSTGKLAKMRDVVEVKGPDHKIMTSYILGEDGKWVQFMTMNSRRKK